MVNGVCLVIFHAFCAPSVGREGKSSQNQELQERLGVLLPRKTLGWFERKPQEVLWRFLADFPETDPMMERTLSTGVAFGTVNPAPSNDVLDFQ